VQQQPQQVAAAFSPHPNPSPRWGEGLSGKLCELFLILSLSDMRKSAGQHGRDPQTRAGTPMN